MAIPSSGWTLGHSGPGTGGSGVENALLLAEVPDRSRFGTVALGPDQRIEGFREKTGEGPGLINAGVYLLSKALFADVPTDRPTSLERDIFPLLAPGRLHGYPDRGPFLDIGTPASYREAEAFFSGHARAR